MTAQKRIMSSQKFRDYEVIEDKIEELRNNGADKIVVPIINSYTQDLEGNNMFIVTDKHHTLSAAIELGIEVEFAEVEDELSSNEDIENNNGEAICREYYMGDEWYYIDITEENAIGENVW